MTLRQTLSSTLQDVQWFLRQTGTWNSKQVLKNFMQCWDRDRDPELFDHLTETIERDVVDPDPRHFDCVGIWERQFPIKEGPLLDAKLDEKLLAFQEQIKLCLKLKDEYESLLHAIVYATD
jgi:hypothetical protein